jgi:putative transcriptional regulator
VIKWKLNLLMADRRITGKELAAELDIHPNTIYRLRRMDEMPSIDGNLLDRLCEVLRCNVTDLIERIPRNDMTKVTSEYCRTTAKGTVQLRGDC